MGLEKITSDYESKLAELNKQHDQALEARNNLLEVCSYIEGSKRNRVKELGEEYGYHSDEVDEAEDFYNHDINELKEKIQEQQEIMKETSQQIEDLKRSYEPILEIVDYLTTSNNSKGDILEDKEGDYLESDSFQ